VATIDLALIRVFYRLTKAPSRGFLCTTTDIGICERRIPQDAPHSQICTLQLTVVRYATR